MALIGEPTWRASSMRLRACEVTDPLSLVVTGPSQHRLQAMPRPLLPIGHVRLRIAAVALCGTDFRLLRGELHDARYPVIPGHEWSAHVVESPDAELIGKLVVGSGYVPCERCEQCQAGACQHCTALDEYGFTLPGACAQEFILPQRNVRLVPDGVDAESACLFEPLTVAIHAIDMAPVIAGRRVVVVGAGAVGLLIMQLANAAGGICTVVEPLPGRAALATGLGANEVSPDASALDERSADIVIDASGAPDAFEAGLRLLAPGGAYVLVGYSGTAECRFMLSTLMLKEITVQGVLSGYGTLDRAIDAVAAGIVRLSPLIGPSMPLADYATLLQAPPDRAPRQPLIPSQ